MLIFIYNDKYACVLWLITYLLVVFYHNIMNGTMKFSFSIVKETLLNNNYLPQNSRYIYIYKFKNCCVTSRWFINQVPQEMFSPSCNLTFNKVPKWILNTKFTVSNVMGLRRPIFPIFQKMVSTKFLWRQMWDGLTIKRHWSIYQVQQCSNFTTGG